MKIVYDPNVDMMSIYLLDDPTVNTITDEDTGVTMFYSETGSLTSIEIEDASQRVQGIDEITIQIFEKIHDEDDEIQQVDAEVTENVIS